MASTEVRPLNVIVVGAGIGGLAVAAALRKAGHIVDVYESSEIKTEIGAGVGMQTNAVRVLKFLGFKRENLKGSVFDWMTIHNAETAESNQHPTRNWEALKNEGIENLSCHRSDLHAELRRLATEEGRLNGPPARLHLGNKVVSCDANAASITLSGGQTVASDVVIGADGVHSIVRTSVIGQDVQAVPTGWACYRCLFDASKIEEHPEDNWAINNLNNVRLEGSQLSEYIIYGVRDKTLVNFVAFHTDPERDPKSPIAQPVSKEAVLERYPAFHAKFLRLFDLPLTTPIIRWQLRAMPLLQTWVKGRTVIMGDAAHATLPLLAQGAAMAIEEAGCLGILFPSGTTPAQVPERLAAFETLRKERGDWVNQQSVAQADPENRVQFTKNADFRAYLTDFDAIKASQDYFDTHFGPRASPV
ncbi:FAD/NAD(P)-binding domain-containing protein [Mycena indigotica]|uniref:FAD/NAD(P)-binding domain-containing protein n=1 Tax=Mycena indigotica TaxID=2126181 RepID=A0A8H6WDN7_9AGAR|nr:FAD/NAD(P)-binding domain-containing protein [Mycena indigotica]KAF7312691.1 FAD/NAD(P)-binding domain-containing protein [Mycena indigotica]